MTMTLLPGRGVELPWAGRSLRFGMTLDEVRASVEPYATLSDTFVCGTAWAKGFALDGIRVCLFADETGVLTGVSATRGDGTAPTPIGLDDIDLFGWPVDEILDVLRDLGRHVRTARTGAWIDNDLRLSWAQDSFVVDLCLYATGNGRAP
jgi:hypothetical protein